MKNFTFKKSPRSTGLSGIGEGVYIDIKRNKRKVGTISGKSWNDKENKLRIRFMVFAPSEHCGWKWVTLKEKFDTEEEVRNYIKENSESIQKSLNIRESELD